MSQYMNLIVVLIIVGASVISFIVRKVQEERDRRRIREERVRRELERLRTGREPDDVEAGDRMERAQELQARRQAQLQELRRRQQERARTQGTQVETVEARIGPGAASPVRTAPANRPIGMPGGASGGASTGTRQPPLVWIPGSSGPTVPQRPVPQRPVPQQRPVPTARRPGSAAPPLRTRPQPDARTARQPQTRTDLPLRKSRKGIFPEAPPAPPSPHATRIAPAPVMAGDIVEPRPPAVVMPRSRSEWRRALILHEILSPPITARASSDGPPELPR